MSYASTITPLAPSHDPRHVEAYMRCLHGMLDHLSPGEFEAEVAVAVRCIVIGGPDMAERLAWSYDL